MKTEEEIFAMMAIAKEQQRAIDNAIVKMTTMAEEITHENQKLFNQNIKKQVEIHDKIVKHANKVLSERIWVKDFIYWGLGIFIVASLVLIATVGYEQYLMYRISDLSVQETKMTEVVHQLRTEGGGATINRCGKDSLPCILVNPGYGSFGDSEDGAVLGKLYYVIATKH